MLDVTSDGDEDSGELPVTFADPIPAQVRPAPATETETETVPSPRHAGPGSRRTAGTTPERGARAAAWWSGLTAVALALGVAVRIRQYLADRSLWLDEASISVNVIDRGFRGLARPLDLEQGAPIGWLELQRLVVVVLGDSERALRLVPLLAGVALLPVTVALGRRTLDPPLVPLLTFLVGSAPALVRYSDEVKQYSSDALAVTVVVLVGVIIAERPPGRVARRDGVALAVVGALATLCSHVAALTVAAVVGVLLVQRLAVRDGRGTRTVLLACLGPTAGGALQGLTTVRQLSANQVLNGYWQDGYPPKGSGPVGALGWLPTAWNRLVADPLHVAGPGVVIVMAVGGAVALARRRGGAVMLVAVVPVIVQVVAALVSAYPLSGRLALDLVPLLLLLAVSCVGLPAGRADDSSRAAGLGWAARHCGTRLAARWRSLTPLLRLLLAAALVAIYLPGGVTTPGRFVTPLRITELRPVMTYLANHRRPGDSIWTYWGSYPVAAYYGQRLGLTLDDNIGDFPSGRACADESLFARYPPGSRVWLVAGALDPHVVYAPPGPGRSEDIDLLQHRMSVFADRHVQVDAHDARVALYTVRARPGPRPASPTDGRCLASLPPPRVN